MEWKKIQLPCDEKNTKTILELLREQGVELASPCGGRGTCGRCLVKYGAVKVRACRTVPSASGTLEISVPVAEEALRWKVAASTALEGKPEVDDEGQDPSELRLGIDIGTTTIGMKLWNAKGQMLGEILGRNSQRSYGADVVSRIQAAMEGKDLQRIIRADLLDGIQRLLALAGIEKAVNARMVIAGNSAMTQILLGESCAGLASAPFSPAVTTCVETDGSVIDEALRDWKVMILPSLTAFVGGDLMADLLGCIPVSELESGSLPETEPGTEGELLVDIGTNGEMILALGGRLFVTSVAAGPVFEGGELSCGMTAGPGAVTHAAWDETKGLMFETLGGSAARGLCGTGALEVLWALRKGGLIDETGLLAEEFAENGYPIEPARGLFFTQQDIRKLQLGIAAVHTGIRLLLRAADIAEQDVKKLRLFGNFGAGLDQTKAAAVGLLPKYLENRTCVTGNGVLLGAERALAIENPQRLRQLCSQLRERCAEVILADEPDFQEFFLQNLTFPAV